MEWTVACLTYNVNGRKADAEHLNRLLSEEDFDDCDIGVFGFQEISHAEILGALNTEETWAWIVCKWMARHSRLLLYRTSLASNLLLVFARLHVFVEIDKMDTRESRATLGGLTGHKGCIALRILFKNRKSLVLITCHLLPNSDGYTRRCEQYGYSKQVAFPEEEHFRKSNTVIWMGDLNWRSEAESAEEMDDMLDEVDTAEAMEALVDRVDQLRRAQRTFEAFGEYSEARVSFAPTYRLIVGTTEFDLLRIPSWCDRVLYRGDHLTCARYRSNRSVTLSDHFPVCARFNYAFSTTSEPSEWNVEFEGMHRWLSIIPFSISFSFRNDFWSTHGSYRDWIGLYTSPMSDPHQPLRWIYVAVCYDTSMQDRTRTVAEFTPLNPGLYQVGYFSVYKNCLQGLSEIIQVDAPP